MGVMNPADLALVLALDASASVRMREFDLMARGLAWALRQPDVVAGLTAGPARASGRARNTSRTVRLGSSASTVPDPTPTASTETRSFDLISSSR